MSPEARDVDHLWVLLCAMLVFIMQGGFLCLEAGLCRTKNSINVAMKNLVDLGVSLLTFWLVGFGIMFGVSQSGWLGTSGFMGNFLLSSPSTTTFFLYQAMFCGAAVTIISGAIAERVKFVSYLCIALLVSLIIYPVMGHWAWGGALHSEQGWLKKLGFIDFAGSTVVHSVGGWIALVLLILIGPRFGRFREGHPPQKVYPSNLPVAMVGVLLLWFGWMGFNGGSTFALTGAVPLIIINTCLAAAAGMIIGVTASFTWQKHMDPLAAMNGTLAGLVAVTAGCYAYSPLQAILIGSIGSLCAYGIDRLLLRIHIDDAVSAVPVHLGAGIWGTLAVALCGSRDVIGFTGSRFDFLLIQALGVVTCAFWCIGVTFCAFTILGKFIRLRISVEVEKIGLNVHEHHASTELVDLIGVMDEHAKTNDYSRKAEIDPFTEVGQIAHFYDKVIIALSKATADIKDSQLRYKTITESSPVGIFNCDPLGIVNYTNLRWSDITKINSTQSHGHPWTQIIHKDDEKRICSIWDNCIVNKKPFKAEFRLRVCDNSPAWSFGQAVPEFNEDSTLKGYVGTITDITDQKILEIDLAHARKMESIGQLAAGIAHEINTPVQYVGDNTNFLRDTFSTIMELQNKFTELLLSAKNDTLTTDIIVSAVNAVEMADLDYLKNEIPTSIAQSLEGIAHISAIVKAMKEFSHPGDLKEFQKSDINRIIENTTTIARGEWKHVADLDLSLDSKLPQVACHPGEIGQVILNIIVNAAHAISDVVNEGGCQKGTIRIQSTSENNSVLIHISDSGKGMPEHIKKRIFDPFFTTKDVGKGTGQGLAIAHKVIVEQHKGTIDVESTEGKGTTFILRLPCAHSND